MSDESTKTMKKALRKQVQGVLSQLQDDLIQRCSSDIAKRLATLAPFQNKSNVSIYLSMPSQEVQTGPILSLLFEQNKRVFVPKVVGKHSGDMKMPELRSLEELAGLERTKWNIPEFSVEQLKARPEGTEKDSLIDVVLAPGVAFTKDCQRLGHGKGYYDSFLTRLRNARKEAGLEPPYFIGIALDEQIYDTVPTSDHDVQLHAIVTPTTVYYQ